MIKKEEESYLHLLYASYMGNNILYVYLAPDATVTYSPHLHLVNEKAVMTLVNL